MVGPAQTGLGPHTRTIHNHPIPSRVPSLELLQQHLLPKLRQQHISHPHTRPQRSLRSHQRNNSYQTLPRRSKNPLVTGRGRLPRTEERPVQEVEAHLPWVQPTADCNHPGDKPIPSGPEALDNRGETSRKPCGNG